MVGTAVAATVAVGLVAVGWTVASKVRSVKGYWDKCRSETVDAVIPSGASWIRATDDDDVASATTTTTATTATWFRVNDVIMGGRSTSELSTTTEGRLVFAGTIDTNGGGFASVRTAESCPVEVPADARAVRIRVEGDGQLWKVNLGSGHSLMDPNPTFARDFLTEKGTDGGGGVVTERVLELSGFSAQRRGRKIEGASLDDPSEIRYVGLILSLVTQDGTPNPRFGDGPFRIVLHDLEFIR